MEITPADLSAATALKHAVAAASCAPMRLFISHLCHDSIEQSLALAAAAAAEKLRAVPHIAVRRYPDIASVAQTLSAFQRCAGVREILVLAGDTPTPAGTLHNSLDLLRNSTFEKILRRTGIQRLWFAVYPEGHAQISATALQSAFREKCAYAKKIRLPVRFISQLTFTAKPLLNWLNTLPATMLPRIHASVFATGRYPSLVHLARLTQTASARMFLQDNARASVAYHRQLCYIAAAHRRPSGLHFLSFGKFAGTMAFAARLRRGQFDIHENSLRVITEQP